MIKVEPGLTVAITSGTTWYNCGHNQWYNVAVIIYAPVFMLYDREDPAV
jgi:hypothetical protein